MNKILTFIFAILFAMPCFATGVSGDSGTCDSGALGTDGGSTILRANYEPETIHLRWYDENNNLLTVNSASQSCTYGDSITIPTAPTKTGYRFTGWTVFSDYTPIEYIQNTGTQYINIGLLSDNNNYDFIVDFMILDFTASAGDKESIFRSVNQNGANRWDLAINATIGKMLFYTNTSNRRYDHTFSLNQRYVVDIDYNRVVINNTQYNYNSPEIGQTNDTLITIFKQGDDNMTARIYSFKVYDNGTLVRDMIPVKDVHGVACMYDKVSGQFFYNAGTGNFVAGPDL